MNKAELVEKMAKEGDRFFMLDTGKISWNTWAKITK
jgi:hypothetical protein